MDLFGDVMRLLVLLAVTLTGACAKPPGATGDRAPMGRTSCAGLASTDSVVYDTTQVTERPLAYDGPPIRYPDGLRREGIQGRVVLSLIVNADGTVDRGSIGIIQMVHPDFVMAAKRWTLGARFWPGCLVGRPVRVRVALPIDFKILR